VAKGDWTKRESLIPEVAKATKDAGVMIRGRWLGQAEVQKRLDEIAASFAKQRTSELQPSRYQLRR
jgi:hypothetical protein